nr:hypothetical protein CFP56_60781 [Quercus suber]
MRSSIFAAVSCLAATAFGACMSDPQAHEVAVHFKTLISAYTNASADAYLAEDFVDTSDSVITLIDGGCNGNPVPLGISTFNSRAAFEAGQGSQPNITFTILNVWHNCDTVFLRWKSDTPNPNTPGNMFAGKGLPDNSQEQVTGIIILETTESSASADVPFLINHVYSEFNSGAWLADLGVFQPTCNSTASSGKTARSVRPRML